MVNWCLLFPVVCNDTFECTNILWHQEFHYLLMFHQAQHVSSLHIQVVLCGYICTSLNSLYQNKILGQRQGSNRGLWRHWRDVFITEEVFLNFHTLQHAQTSCYFPVHFIKFIHCHNNIYIISYHIIYDRFFLYKTDFAFCWVSFP